MKKIVCMISLAFLLAACGNNNESNADNNDSIHAHPAMGDTGNAGTSGAGNVNGMENSTMDRINNTGDSVITNAGSGDTTQITNNSDSSVQ